MLEEFTKGGLSISPDDTVDTNPARKLKHEHTPTVPEIKLNLIRKLLKSYIAGNENLDRLKLGINSQTSIFPQPLSQQEHIKSIQGTEYTGKMIETRPPNPNDSEDKKRTPTEEIAYLEEQINLALDEIPDLKTRRIQNLIKEMESGMVPFGEAVRFGEIVNRDVKIPENYKQLLIDYIKNTFLPDSTE